MKKNHNALIAAISIANAVLLLVIVLQAGPGVTVGQVPPVPLPAPAPDPPAPGICSDEISVGNPLPQTVESVTIFAQDGVTQNATSAIKDAHLIREIKTAAAIAFGAVLGRCESSGAGPTPQPCPKGCGEFYKGTPSPLPVIKKLQALLTTGAGQSWQYVHSITDLPDPLSSPAPTPTLPGYKIGPVQYLTNSNTNAFSRYQRIHFVFGSTSPPTTPLRCVSIQPC